MNDIEAFIRDAAQQRGITADVAILVAQSEGGITEYARRGTFSTGSSWWPFQLHYGGAGYEQFGTVAGMGNGFTALTGWQPGDPRAWRDSVRYALNRAKANGWGAWYGAAAAGISTWYGIDRSASWGANAEQWDYEIGVNPVPDPPAYNADVPVVQQQHDWDCAEQSTLWGVTALGRHPSDAWMEGQMLADAIESTALGLLDGTGAALAAWITREYSDPSEGTPTLKAVNAATVSFDDVKSLAGTTSVLLGGHHWGAAGHWSGVRGYDATSDMLLLANPANGYAGISQTMNRQQFAQVAPCAMVVIRADGTVPAPPPPPPPPQPPSPSDTIRAQLVAIRAATDAIEAALA